MIPAHSPSLHDDSCQFYRPVLKFWDWKTVSILSVHWSPLVVKKAQSTFRENEKLGHFVQSFLQVCLGSKLNCRPVSGRFSLEASKSMLDLIESVQGTSAWFAESWKNSRTKSQDFTEKDCRAQTWRISEACFWTASFSWANGFHAKWNVKFTLWRETVFCARTNWKCICTLGGKRNVAPCFIHARKYYRNKLNPFHGVWDQYWCAGKPRSRDTTQAV